MHNTVWNMNDRNCIVLGPTAPLEYLVLQRVLVSYTESSVSNIILDVHLITEIVLYVPIGGMSLLIALAIGISRYTYLWSSPHSPTGAATATHVCGAGP